MTRWNLLRGCAIVRRKGVQAENWEGRKGKMMIGCHRLRHPHQQRRQSGETTSLLQRGLWQEQIGRSGSAGSSSQPQPW